MLSNQETLSCLEDAKATDAQVNVVMPDKAFVEQLQRELAGLDSELSSGPTSITSDFSALLREKDSQIKKMKKEVKKLSLQLDLAHSQVKDLLRRVGDGGDKTALMVGDEGHNYPKLRVRSSLDDESQISVDLADSQNLDLGVGSFDASQYSDGHSRSSSAENLFQLPDSNENSLQTHSSPRLSVYIPHSVGINEYQEETEGQTDEKSEYPCKEVRCIEKEEPNTNRYEESNMSGSGLNANLKTTISDSCLNRCLSSNMSDSNLNKYIDSNISSPVADTATSGVTMVENGDNVNQELQSAWLKGGEDLRGALPNFVVVSPKKPSQFPMEKDTPNLICLSLTRSRSCKASVMTGPSSLWFEKIEKQDSTSSIGFEKELTGRPEGLQLNLSALKYYAIEDSMSRSNSETSAGSAAANDLVVQDAESSSVKNYTCTCTSTTGVNEIDNLQCDNKHADTVVLEIETKSLASEKNVKDVCSDPTQDDTKSPQKWQSEFNRLQREIIELWHACNISLVHRSYFFLLFKGDPADSIYMEVELRRLTFLKEVFSRGSKTLEDGKTLTPASSMKALRHERQMLSKQIQARFSKTERENLYLKWGIGINSQNRRLQLLHRLWSDTKDMDHITESATIVAKLVGTVEPGHGFKEMFQLNFAPGRSFRKATGWKPKIKYHL